MADRSKIKVLEVIQQGEIGGGESHLLTLIGKMNRERFEPVVIALSNGEMINRLNQMSIKNYVVSTKLPFNVTVWKRIRSILKENEIDVVHTHGARALSNLLQPASSLSIPVVHTVHGWSFHDHLPSWKRKLRIRGENFLTGKADLNIAVSESNRKIAVQKFGRFNGVVINNGVDLSVYGNRNGDAIRKEFRIPANTVIISFVARFIHDKNPLPLIRAFSEANKKFPESYLIMVGDGPARESAVNVAEELGLSGKIRFPGFRSDVPDILAASDIFCLPSIKEGLPVSLIEAMAMNNAVIATDVQGCIDVITDGKDGLLVPLQNLEQGLANALFQLLESTEKRKQLAASGRQTVESRFDANTMARRIEEVYLGLLEPKTENRTA